MALRPSLLARSARPLRWVHTMSAHFDPRTSRIVQSRPLANDQAKWIGLRAIEWVDPSGKTRWWNRQIGLLVEGLLMVRDAH